MCARLWRILLLAMLTCAQRTASLPRSILGVRVRRAAGGGLPLEQEASLPSQNVVVRRAPLWPSRRSARHRVA